MVLLIDNQVWCVIRSAAHDAPERKRKGASAYPDVMRTNQGKGSILPGGFYASCN